MLLFEKTLNLFGYTFDSLSRHSKKPIWISCDYCGVEYTTIKDNRINAHKVIPKDACKKCKYIKMGDMNELKYGVRYTSQIQSVKDKIVATNLERYGVVRPTQCQEIKDKVKKTCLERFGTEYAIQSDIVLDKKKKTCLEKFGYENPSSAEVCKEKRKQTCLEKFGSEHYLGSEDCLSKTINKFGVDNVFKLDEYQKVAFQSKINNGSTKIFDGIGVKAWADKLGYSREHLNVIINKFGWEKAIQSVKSITILEMAIISILEKHNIEFIYNKKYKQYYPDFQIGNLIIEADGLFFHSEAVQEDNLYHFKKKQFYLSEGFDSVFFRHDEIMTKSAIVENIILDRLNLLPLRTSSNVIELTNGQADEFFYQNHMFGSGEGITFAITDVPQVSISPPKIEILSALRVVEIDQKWQISRFATRLGSATTGFGILLDHFNKAFNNPTIEQIINLRYEIDKDLKSAGFMAGEPQLGFEWTNGKEIFDVSTTGCDSGLYKIWDCGQLKYVK